MLSIKLPKLSLSKINMDNTFRKLVEEVSECELKLYELEMSEMFNRAIIDKSKKNLCRELSYHIACALSSEVMDIAQTCASQLFIFKDSEVDIYTVFKNHFLKVDNFDDDMAFSSDLFLNKSDIFISIGTLLNNYFYEIDYNNTSFPETTKYTYDQDTDFHHILKNIRFCQGRIAQLGKYVGINGEKQVIKKDEAIKYSVIELFKILQLCSVFLSRIGYKHSISFPSVYKDHIDKLKRKKYLLSK